ncbi:MAG: hypothetical protein GX117_03045 [Candidatus Hydrogenedentes bacterium]|jgi:hypothetical protein|nr:hypothetical protein [Candidatus Hydrogenedentota bacterium]
MKLTSFRFAALILFLFCGVIPLATAQIAIDSFEDLLRIGADPDYPLYGRYTLTQDIDASNSYILNGGAGFQPIGPRLEDDDSVGFSGVFDGQGYAIHNLFINRPDEQGVGLFGSIAASGKVINLGLVGGSITGSHYTGSLVGENWSAAVAGCFSDTTVSGISRVGGLAGINRGSLTACYALGAVNGIEFVGGLVGRNYEGLIQESYAAASVSGSRWAGGLVGQSVDAQALACFWDTTLSLLPVSDGGSGLTTDFMQRATDYLAAGWDFRSVWTIKENRGYPQHKALWE